MHPRAPCELAVVEPVLAPIRRGFDELVCVVRAVFQRAFDDDIDVGFQEWKAGIRFRQAFARHAVLAYGNIDLDMARFRQALPRDRLDVVARHFHAGIALLARIELRHIVAFDRVEHAVDRGRALTRMWLSQAKCGEAGGRTVVPGAATPRSKSFSELASRILNPIMESRNAPVHISTASTPVSRRDLKSSGVIMPPTPSKQRVSRRPTSSSEITPGIPVIDSWSRPSAVSGRATLF